MVYANSITLFIIISLLTSQIFADEDDVSIEYTNILCDLLQKNNKHVFDYVSERDVRDTEYYMMGIQCDVGSEQRDGLKYYEFTLMYMGIWNDTAQTHTGPKEIQLQPHGNGWQTHKNDTVLRFRTEYIRSCEFKANANQFECYADNWHRFSVKPFGCPDQHIDMRSVIAYYPNSYYTSNDTRNSVLFVGRTQRTIMISDWSMSWYNQRSPVCHQINDTNTNSIIPKFLFDIEKNLEITGILGTIDEETNKPLALILFYDSGQHKYCVTEENQLNITCRRKNLKTYMKCLHQYVNTTDPTDEESESTTTMLTPINDVVNNTTHSLPSNKLKSIWIVMAIIAIVLLIIGICVCALIYLVYRSKNKSQTGKTNDESDKQISDSTHGLQPQQQSETSDQNDETNVEYNT